MACYTKICENMDREMFDHHPPLMPRLLRIVTYSIFVHIVMGLSKNGRHFCQRANPPKILLRVCSNSVPHFMLVSSNAQFSNIQVFHLSAGPMNLFKNSPCIQCTFKQQSIIVCQIWSCITDRALRKHC